MCGIAGIFGAEETEILRDMLKVLRHRGPDDEYYVGDRNFCLGARRLSIIDIEGGRQPLSGESGQVWVAQNGEIYNFPEERKRLSEAGHIFRTRSDTEVIAHLYEEQGEEFVHFLKGMFAVAVWDGKKKEGVLVRDRVGKKPLYYTLRNGVLYFASEIKSLLKIPGFNREVNTEALHYYLSYKNVPCPLSIFRGIYQLTPGSLLRYKPGRGIEIRKYWRADFSPLESGISEDELTNNIISHLLKAVERRLISDVEIGFLLSGGIDSSLLVALASQVSSKKLRTFTLAYSGDASTPGKMMDRECAGKVSGMYGTQHYEEIIRISNFEEELPKIISCFDEPFSGVISPYFLARLIARHVKVAVSGDGSDELFGSYLTHRIAFPISNYLLFKKTRDERYREFYSFDEKFLAQKAEEEDWKWRSKFCVFTDEEKECLYSGGIRSEIGGHRLSEHMGGYFGNMTAKDPLNRILEAEFKFQLPDQVLTFGDRLSMAHSLEVRNPYLDHEFVAFAARIPGRLKMKGGETKHILKKAALKFLPEDMVFRQKEGFIMPVEEWLFDKMEGYVRSMLSEKKISSHGFFSREYISTLLNEFYGGKREHSRKINTLLMFQVWYDGYIA